VQTGRLRAGTDLDEHIQILGTRRMDVMDFVDVVDLVDLVDSKK